MAIIQDKTFKDECIELDGSDEYVNCVFIRCRLKYTGGELKAYSCRFEQPVLDFARRLGRLLHFPLAPNSNPPESKSTGV